MGATIVRPMDRAYSLLTIKSIDAPTRRIQGIASTPDVDRDGDVLDPAGVTFRNPVPLLLHHRQTEPIGTAVLTVIGVLEPSRCP